MATSGGTNTFGQDISQGGGSIVPSGPGTPVTQSNPPSTISVDGLNQTQSPIQIPSAPTIDTHTATNASIPNPTPTTQDIINKDTGATASQGQQSDILSRVAALMQNKQSLATLQTQQEQQGGVFDQQAALNQINDQIQGLSDQSTALQTAAGPGGTIENQGQQQALKGLTTSGGLQPMTAAALRTNQIQQATIAAQSLTLKSAYYTANNKLTLAKAAADRAAQVQFDATQQQIDYQNSLLAAIQPQLDKEGKAQAAQLQSDLADRQQQINFQREDFKTGQAAIADALKNNPNDTNAANAAHQAAQLDPKDPNYLSKVQQLVAPFASDVAMRALDIATKQGQNQLQQAQIKQIPLDIALKNAQLTGVNLNNEKTAVDIQNLKNAGVNLGNANMKTTTSGTQYIDGTNLTGTDQSMVQKFAAKNGIPYVGKDQADTLTDVANAQLNQVDIINQIQGLLPKDSTGHVIAQATVPLAQLFQTNDQIAAFNSWRTAAINTLRATAGSKGLRINQAEIYAATQNDIPQLTDTLGTAQQKFNNIQTLLKNSEDSILQNNKQDALNATEPSDRSKGTVWIRPEGKFVSDGTQWVKQ